MDTLARVIVAVAMFAIGIGSLSGSAPNWPNETAYGLAAFVMAGLWAAAALEPRHAALNRVAVAGLLAAALLRGAGYAIELARTGVGGLWAATGAWVLVIALLIHRPLEGDR